MTEPGGIVLARLAQQWADMGPPVIVFNKSHSGSRLLARLLIESGIHLGLERNESEDAYGFLDLVRPMVERHYPDYSKLMREGDADLGALATAVVERQLRGVEKGRRWGWKLCETLYILPILHRVFPGAHFIHLIRDGRDVAFSDHVAPQEPFWRKVYFDTAEVERWQERPLTEKSYRRAPHVFNARHWANSVQAARHFGAMIGENYHEVRYEDLLRQPRETGWSLLSNLGLTPDGAVLETFAASIDLRPLGKFRNMPRRKQIEAEAVLRPTLEAFGYGIGEELPRRFPWLRRP